VAKVDELVTSHIADVRDYNKLYGILSIVQPDMVFHLAAQPLVRDSYKNPVDTYAINVMGTVNLLEAVRHTKLVKAMVNVTTDKCYENKEWL
jgi:CDP-glucose 4,6-dehydratase